MVTHTNYHQSTSAEFSGISNELAVEIMNAYCAWRRKRNKPTTISTSIGELVVGFESERTSSYHQSRSLSFYFHTTDAVVRISDHWSSSKYDKSKKLNCGMIRSCRWNSQGDSFYFNVPAQSYGSDLIAGICPISEFIIH